MATIYKRKGSTAWYVRWYDSNGQPHWRSTRTANRKQAEATAATWDKAISLGRVGSLTADKAREVLVGGIEDIFLAANAEALPKTTVRIWCSQWLESKKIENAPTTFERYEGIVQRFFDFLGAKVDKDIATLEAKDVLRFRDQLAQELSTASANLAVKTLRACLGAATKHGLVTKNVASLVSKLKTSSESKRRAFTVPEIRKILDTAGDSEWRGIILSAVYTSARLGDIARFTWGKIVLDSEKQESERKPLISYFAHKPGRWMVVPLARPLADYFESLPSTDDPDAFVFPKAAAANKTGTLSNQFYSLMVEAGLAEPRTKKNTGKGRHASRAVGEISFHSFRHSAVTFLKAASVSGPVAEAIAGHESAAMSRVYTHLDTETLRGAVDKLPDVTKRGD